MGAGSLFNQHSMGTWRRRIWLCTRSKWYFAFKKLFTYRLDLKMLSFLIISDIDTESWPPICSEGPKQTPIDLTNAEYYDDWLPFIFSHYQRKPYKMMVENTGTTALVTLDPEGCDDNRPKISQGGLDGTYEFAQLHFHWGWYHMPGSEHEIDGVSV